MGRSTKTHVLYRFYDRRSRLLYVGITMRPLERFTEHRKTKTWWGCITDIRLEYFHNRTDLEAAEREAIRSENPKYNIAHAIPQPPVGSLLLDDPYIRCDYGCDCWTYQSDISIQQMAYHESHELLLAHEDWCPDSTHVPDVNENGFCRQIRITIRHGIRADIPANVRVVGGRRPDHVR